MSTRHDMQLPSVDSINLLARTSADGSGTDEHHDFQHSDSDVAWEQSENEVDVSWTTTTNAKFGLYVSHFLSTWNSRVFEFAAVLYLASIFPITLLPMSVYALIRGASAIVFSSAIGSHIDRSSRLSAIRISIVMQRLAVGFSCALFWLLKSTWKDESIMKIGALFLLAVLACVEKVFAIMNSICVEKDWVVVIANQDEESLSVMNSQMRRIDLICKLGGPLIIALISGYSLEVSILSNFAMSYISVGYEYYAISKVHQAFPALQGPKAFVRQSTPVNHNSWGPGFGCSNYIASWMNDATSYFRHNVFLPSFACAILYFTVLSFGGQMITYLLSTGYTATEIGIARTISVALEVAATWSAPMLMAKIGPIRSGIWFLNWQLLCLIGAGCFFYGAGSASLSVSGLVIGTMLSRVGLWGYVLSSEILVQNEVGAAHRGSFASQEAQWQSVFEMLSLTSTVIFPEPDQFRWPVLMSCVAVAVSAGVYASFVRLRRGHLLHISTCVSKDSYTEVIETE